MSSDGITRKSTKGWEISPSGGMSLGKSNVVVIEEPTVPAMAAMNEAAKAEAAQAEAAKSEAAQTEVSAAPPDEPRPRRTTLDLFNDEMAVMERPIEGDVEYVDEKPPSRWRPLAAFIGVVAVVGVGGAFLISHRHSAVAARAADSAAAPVVAAAAPAAPVAPAPAAAAAAAPAAAPADDGEADEQPAADASSWKAPARTEWTKTRTKVTQSKHARAGGGKTVYRRTTTTTVKHRHVVKRTVSGRR
jgi:hypothetical protein